MSEFCYILDDQKGTRLHLSDEGPQAAPADLAGHMNRDGFRHVEDRRVRTCTLHVFKRTTPATDIVPDSQSLE